MKEREWKCHVGRGYRRWGVGRSTLLITFAANPRGLQVVSPTQLVLVRDHLPFPPSPPLPSEDLDVKTSLGMQRYVMSFVGGWNFILVLTCGWNRCCRWHCKFKKVCNKSYIGQFSDKYYVCYRVKFCNAKRSSKKKDGSSSIGKKVFSTVLEVLCEFSSWACFLVLRFKHLIFLTHHLIVLIFSLI